MGSLTPIVAAMFLMGGQPNGVVVDFSSKHCVPCQEMSPIVERLKRQGYSIQKVDIEERPDLKRRFNITSIPTFVLIVNGKEVQRVEGKISEQTLRRMAMQIPTKPAATQIAATNSPMSTKPATMFVAQNSSGLERAQLGAAGDFDELLPAPPKMIARANLGNEAPSPVAPAKRKIDSQFATTVRLRAKDGKGMNFGTGTIIESVVGRTLILTCGHVVADATANSKIEVDVFAQGDTRTYIGTVVDFDREADVGLVTIPTSDPVKTSKVSTGETKLAVNDKVYSIGCSGGADPTRENIQVTAMNRYLGPDNIECSSRPAGGRSGGGLFDLKGEIVGVCFASDPEEPYGLYCGLKPIHAILEKNGFQHLFKTEEEVVPETRIFAESKAVEEVETEMEQAFASSQPLMKDENVMPASATSPSNLSPEQIQQIQSTLAQSSGAKLTIIIESPDNPHRTQVVIIPAASKKLIAQLTGTVGPNEAVASSSMRLTSVRKQVNDVRLPRPLHRNAASEKTKATQPRAFYQSMYAPRTVIPQRYQRSANAR